MQVNRTASCYFYIVSHLTIVVKEFFLNVDFLFLFDEFCQIMV